MKSLKKKNESVNVQVLINSLTKQAKPKSKKVVDLTIKNQDDFDLVGQLVKDVKNMGTTAKAKESEIVDPIMQGVKKVKELFRPFYASVALIEDIGKKKMQAWLDSKKLQEQKLLAQAEKGTIKTSTLMNKLKDTVVFKSPAAKVREIDVLVIYDESKLPRKFLMPDESAIKAALKEGKTIPGARFEKQNSIAI